VPELIRETGWQKSTIRWNLRRLVLDGCARTTLDAAGRMVYEPVP